MVRVNWIETRKKTISDGFEIGRVCGRCKELEKDKGGLEREKRERRIIKRKRRRGKKKGGVEK